MNGILASPSRIPSLHQLKPKIIPNCSYPSNFVLPCTLHDHISCSSDVKLKSFGYGVGRNEFQKSRLQCNSSSRPGGSGSGENESRTVLDAFFLGKAFAEALNERIESTVGEILSTVGRLQAEQQKQVQDFQEDVLERAKRAKEKAAREAMEAQTLIPKSTTSTVSTGGSTASPDAVGPAKSSSFSSSAVGPADVDPNSALEDPIVEVSNNN